MTNLEVCVFLYRILFRLSAKKSTLCYRNPIMVDYSHTFLQFENKTELMQDVPPQFNMDAHLMKERVWSSLSLPGQFRKRHIDKMLSDFNSIMESTLLERHSNFFLSPPMRTLTYLIRPLPFDIKARGHTRAFSLESERQLQDLLRALCTKYNFQFTIVDFGTKSFEEQVAIMRNTGIMVALHGAGVVNSMFMPTGAALIEIVPWGFHRGRHYIQGGNTNLWYHQHFALKPKDTGHFPLPFEYNELVDGPRYNNVKLEDYSTLYRCLEKNQSCRSYYRDQIVTLIAADISSLQLTLEGAVSYIESLQRDGLYVIRDRE